MIPEARAQCLAGAPPRNIERSAEEITQTLFPDVSPAALVWSGMKARTPERGDIWVADVYYGEMQTGRLVFEENGRLRVCSCRIFREESPLRVWEDALIVARAKLHALQRNDWYNCHLIEEKPFRSPGQTGGSWYLRGQKPGKRILLTLDARTGALLFFSETISGPTAGPQP